MEALKDADKTVELKPDWSKGHSRRGAALSYLGRDLEAEKAYEKGKCVHVLAPSCFKLSFLSLDNAFHF